MKRIGIVLFVLIFAALPSGALAKMGSGKVTAKSSDVDIQIFGSLKTYPTFIANPDFNSDQTKYDFILDENGFMSENSIRSEARLGFKGQGDNWSFLTILEADFTYNKQNGDRGADRTDPLDSGMTGEDFGIEKLEFTYDFGPFTLKTGWQTKALEIHTGGVLYGDDHPYIGLSGKIHDVGWDLLYITVFDDIKNLEHGKPIGPLDSDALDWRVYTARLSIPYQGFTIAPFYAFSDNKDHKAHANYLGFETYGKYGMVVPRAEFVYAIGDEDVGNDNYDISAWAAFLSFEFDVQPYFKPYIGGYFISGDDDANDKDINAFNPITNISRYSPTFGMENAFIYRYIPALGSHLYSNSPDVLGKTPGYGGIGNSAKAESPGMMMLGAGAKGKYDNWSYKTQLMYFWFENTGALEDVYNVSDIDSAMGLEYDLQITYEFNKHFSLGNVAAVFVPGDGVQDIRGDDYDETAFMDTIEMKWKF